MCVCCCCGATGNCCGGSPGSPKATALSSERREALLATLTKLQAPAVTDANAAAPPPSTDTASQLSDAMLQLLRQKSGADRFTFVAVCDAVDVCVNGGGWGATLLSALHAAGVTEALLAAFGHSSATPTSTLSGIHAASALCRAGAASGTLTPSQRRAGVACACDIVRHYSASETVVTAAVQFLLDLRLQPTVPLTRELDALASDAAVLPDASSRLTVVDALLPAIKVCFQSHQRMVLLCRIGTGVANTITASASDINIATKGLRLLTRALVRECLEDVVAPVPLPAACLAVVAAHPADADTCALALTTLANFGARFAATAPRVTAGVAVVQALVAMKPHTQAVNAVARALPQSVVTSLLRLLVAATDSYAGSEKHLYAAIDVVYALAAKYFGDVDVCVLVLMYVNVLAARVSARGLDDNNSTPLAVAADLVYTAATPLMAGATTTHDRCKEMLVGFGLDRHHSEAVAQSQVTHTRLTMCGVWVRRGGYRQGRRGCDDVERCAVCGVMRAACARGVVQCRAARVDDRSVACQCHVHQRCSVSEKWCRRRNPMYMTHTVYSVGNTQ